MTAGHPDAARVTLCSSDDTQCTPAGVEPNALVQTDGADCLAFTTAADGYVVKDLDCTGVNTCSSEVFNSAIEQLDPGNRDLTFEGGVFDGYTHLTLMYTQAIGNPENLVFGTCSNRMEFRNCHSHQARWVVYGACKDCAFSLWVHDWGSNDAGGLGQGHILDFNFWQPGDSPTENVLIECNLWEIDCAIAQQVGSAVNASYGGYMTFRDNVVRNVDPLNHCGAGLHFDAHAGDDDVGWNGAEIHRNDFDMGSDVGWVIKSSLGTNLDIYNNLFKLLGPASIGGHGQVLYVEEESSVEPPGVPLIPHNIRFFNNTIRADKSDWPLFSIVAGAGHQIFNNLIINATPATHKVDGIPGAEVFDTDDCARFGAGGVNLHHNFVYSPNDTTPLITPCPASQWLPGAPWSTDPGLVDSANGNFDILRARSAVVQLGTPVNAPPDDHHGEARPMPPSPGADDIQVPPRPPACGLGPELVLPLALAHRLRSARRERHAG
jgi:hypothetical protein